VNKGTLIFPILSKDSRLGEVYTLCINRMCFNFRLCYFQLMFVCWEFRINCDETENRFI